MRSESDSEGTRAWVMSRCLAWHLVLLCLAVLSACAQPREGQGATDIVNGRPVPELLERFDAWLRANGARYDKVVARWSPAAGFHIQVTEACSSGETIVHMPLRMMLGPKYVEASWLRTILAPLPVPEQVLVMLLWEDANKTSFFRPYLDMLPQTFDTPLFWTRAQAIELQGSPLLESSIALRHEMPGSYHFFKANVLDKHAALFPADGFSYERYLWAYSIVRSRSFGNYTLMPLIDLMNHHPLSRLAPTLMADGSGDRLLLRNALAPGDEVWGFYGFKSDRDLLASYGFTTAPAVNNPFSSIEIALEMDLDRPAVSALAGLKQVLLRSLGMAPSNQAFVVYKGALPPTLMTYLLMDAVVDGDGEGALRAAAQAALVEEGRQVAQRVLRSTLLRLQQLLQRLLRRYPTTLVEVWPSRCVCACCGWGSLPPFLQAGLGGVGFRV